MLQALNETSEIDYRQHEEEFITEKLFEAIQFYDYEAPIKTWLNDTIDFFQEIYDVPVETVGQFYHTYSNFSTLSMTYKIGQGDFDFVSIQNNQSRQSLDDANEMIKGQMDTLRYVSWDYKLFVIHQIDILWDTIVEFYALGYQVFLGWLWIHLVAQWFILPGYIILLTLWLTGVFLYSITVIPVQLLIFAIVASIYVIITVTIVSVLIWLYEYFLYFVWVYILQPIAIVGYLTIIPFALPFWFLNEYFYQLTANSWWSSNSYWVLIRTGLINLV